VRGEIWPHLVFSLPELAGHTATYQNICCCVILQSTTTIKKQWLGRDFVIFFISALHFWIEYYTDFLNLTKFVSQHLIATHGHFHRHQFLTACFELFGGGHGHLAVATLCSRDDEAAFLHTPEGQFHPEILPITHRQSPLRVCIALYRNRTEYTVLFWILLQLVWI
jgi:hypothetical protein